MKRIKYKKLSVQNFLSIGNDTIEVDFQKGLNLITGQNIDNPDRKNAVGKSALMSAYFFGLFGETIGKINIDGYLSYPSQDGVKIENQFPFVFIPTKDNIEKLSNIHKKTKSSCLFCFLFGYM